MKKDTNQAARGRKYYLKNRDSVIARSKKWKEDNPELVIKWKMANRKKHAKYAIEYDKEYRRRQMNMV